MKWNRRVTFILSDPVMITKASKMLVAFCRTQRMQKTHCKMTTGVLCRHTGVSPVAPEAAFSGKGVGLGCSQPEQFHLASRSSASGSCAPRADNRGHSLCARRTARLLSGSGEQGRTRCIPPRGSPDLPTASKTSTASAPTLPGLPADCANGG